MRMHDMWLPSPPDGYEEYEDPPDSIPRKIRIAVHLGVVIAIVATLYLSLTRYGGLSFGNQVVGIGVVVFVFVVTAIHELIHILISKVAGWETVFRIEWDGLQTTPMVQSYGAYQERKESLLFYLAPVFSLTSAGIPMIMSTSPLISTIGIVVLISTWAGSVQDFYNAWIVLQLPVDVVEYHNSAGDVRYYVPV